MRVLRSRAEPVLKYLKPEHNVLDIGCVGMGDNDVLGGDDFMHGEFSKRVNYLKGVDINQVGVIKMVLAGYKVECYDAQKPFNVGHDLYDVVISEENIEHIFNLDGYLKNVRNHLKENGLFIITTPNAGCFDYFIHNLFWGRLRINPTHTHIHSRETIRYLLEYYDFKIIKIETFQAINWKLQNLGGKIMFFIARLLPSRLGRNMVIIAKKKE